MDVLNIIMVCFFKCKVKMYIFGKTNASATVVFVHNNSSIGASYFIRLLIGY